MIDEQDSIKSKEMYVIASNDKTLKIALPEHFIESKISSGSTEPDFCFDERVEIVGI